MDESAFNWVRDTSTKRIIIRAEYRSEEGFKLYGLRPELFDQIGLWCAESGYGRRTAYNQFEFKTEKDLTFFLLRWSQA